MRHTALISAIFLVALVGSASADRLGGAYRGPFLSHDGPPAHPRGFLPAIPENARIWEEYSFWPFFYEHNKEWILAERITARRALARGAAGAVDPKLVDRVMAVLAQAIEDPEALVRDAAIIALGKTGREAAVPLLATRLKSDPDLEIREDALLALGLTGRESALPFLREALPDVRYRAYPALGLALAGDRESVPVILARYAQALEHRDETAAGELATALGHLVTEEKDVDVLAAPLRLKDREWLQVPVCHALGLVNTERCRKWLLRAAADRNSAVCAAAFLALDVPRDGRETRLFLGKYPHRMAMIYTIRGLCLSPPRIRALGPENSTVAKIVKAAAENTRKDIHLAQHTALALGIAGVTDANDFFLAEMVPDRNSTLPSASYSAMAVALGFTGDLRAKPKLLELATDPKFDPELRGYAALALALMEARDTLPALRRALAEPGAPVALVRSGCWALGLMGDADDTAFLLATLSRTENDWETTCGAAAIALGLIADESAVDPLLKLAGSAKSPRTRAFAIAALGWLVDHDPAPRIPLLFERFHYRQNAGVFRDVMRNL